MAEERTQRRLAAILAADVVGFSRLMESNEAGTLATLIDRRKNVLEPLVARHKGRIFKVAGDGVMVEFSSAVNAVRCAMDLQQGMEAADEGRPAHGRIRLRIGISLGDVMVEGGDLYGDGVNIAARLEGLAEPGGILLSGAVHDYVRSNVTAAFDDLGPQDLKNITEPVRTYRVRGTTADPIPARFAAEKPSIAVLPFANMSADPTQEFLADGITEDLITQLSRFRELFVISRSSSFAFKGKTASIPEVAGRLGVQYVAEGSIRVVGDRVRVSAQLVDGRRDVHVWADQYDRELKEIFDLQDELVRTIAATLVGRLGHATHERTKRQSAGDLRAYELYVRGLEHFFAWTPTDNRKAIDLFRLAVDTEPDYAAAHAALSEAVLRGWLNGWTESPEADLTDSLRIAERSVQLDDGDSRTHVSLGLVSMYHRLHDQARMHLEKAARLNPSDVHALAYLSRLELFGGNSDLAIGRIREASKLNPFGKYGWYLGQAFYVAGRYDEAVMAFKSLSEPTAMVVAWLAASQAMAGQAREARSCRETFAAMAERDPVVRIAADARMWADFVTRRWPFQKGEHLECLFTGLRRAGLAS